MTEDIIEIDVHARERRLYDRLRARLVDSQPGQRSGFGDLLLLVPDLAVLLARLTRDPRVPRGAKVVAGLALGYVVSPIDLIPEFLGPIGMIDDLLILTAALSRLVNYVHPDVVRSHWSGQGDVLDAIQRLSEWGETALVDHLPAVFRRFLPGQR